MSATPAAPDRSAAPGSLASGAPQPSRGSRPPGRPVDSLTGPLQDLRAFLREHPELSTGPGLTEDEELGDQAPAVREVLKAGFWDRARGDGCRFAAGGVTDRLPPGPVLAGFAADVWDDGLARVSDDELIGVLRAARRLASWATALEFAAAGDLWHRRVAEEEAGDTGAALHAGAEIAAALTLTNRAGDRLLDLAAALRRLPATSRALAAGDIDVPRAIVIVNAVTGLTDEHVARVERAIIGAAPGQTTGQLSAAAHRAAIAADPAAARERKEQALREARVERWDEHAGTAALAGRDLPPAAVLAADHNLTALAKQLKAAGTPGTLDFLRARVYLALLSGAPVTSLLPASPDGENRPADDDTGGDFPALTPPATLSARGTVNLTLPLATWLGLADVPGHCPGFGPLDAADSRDLAAALARRPGNRWCLTFTDPNGRPIAHGCARTGPPPSRRSSRPAAGTRDRPAAGTRDRPATGRRYTAAAGLRDGPRAGPRERPAARTPEGPRAGPRERPAARTPEGPRAGPRDTTATGSPGETWTFSITPLTGGGCDHAWETPAYRPSPALRHLIEIRHATCVFPGCRRPASQCDIDHTIAYERGGKTCLCNLAPLCRRHHEVKQTPGWRLEQTSPGVLTWTTPSGRRYPA